MDLDNFIAEIKDEESYETFYSGVGVKDHILQAYGYLINQSNTESYPPTSNIIIPEKSKPLNARTISSTEKEWHMKVQSTINRLQSSVRKEKSPSVNVQIGDGQCEAVIDEGAELNCIDEAFCLERGIKFKKTILTATAAGKNRMSLTGETEEDIVLKPMSSVHIKVIWNLGPCVVVKNLGNPVLIGEPAKKDNKIVTIAHERKILARDIEGNKISINYIDKKKSQAQSFLCRAQENTSLFEGESLQFQLPDSFSDTEIIIAPKRDFNVMCDWPSPAVLRVLNNQVSIPNNSGRTIIIKKNQHFAEVTTLRQVKVEDLRTENVKKVYDVGRTDLSHLILPDRPAIDEKCSYINDVQIDPDDQLTSEWKQKFSSLCETYTSIITPVPGRYNGYYGHVDNSLTFSSSIFNALNTELFLGHSDGWWLNMT